MRPREPQAGQLSGVIQTLRELSADPPTLRATHLLRLGFFFLLRNKSFYSVTRHVAKGNTALGGSNLNLNLQERAKRLASQKRRAWALESEQSSSLALPDVSCVASGLLVPLSEPEMPHL